MAHEDVLLVRRPGTMRWHRIDGAGFAIRTECTYSGAGHSDGTAAGKDLHVLRSDTAYVHMLARRP